MKRRNTKPLLNAIALAGSFAVAAGVHTAHAECNAEKPAIQGQKEPNPCAAAKPAGKNTKGCNPCTPQPD